MVKCKVCNKEFKVMTTAHVKTHGFKSLTEYNEAPESEEIKETETIEETQSEKLSLPERIWGSNDKRLNMTVREFITQYDITLRELNEIVNQYKYGFKINPATDIKNKSKIAKKTVEKFKDLDNVETTSLYEAEALEKHFGFKCVNLKSKPVKTWVLKK